MPLWRSHFVKFGNRELRFAGIGELNDILVDAKDENGKSDLKEKEAEAGAEKEPLKELSPNQTPAGHVEAS